MDILSINIDIKPTKIMHREIAALQEKQTF